MEEEVSIAAILQGKQGVLRRTVCHVEVTTRSAPVSRRRVSPPSVQHLKVHRSNVAA